MAQSTCLLYSVLMAGRRSTNHSARFRVPRECPHTPALAAWIKRHNTGCPCRQLNLKRTIESVVKLSAVGCVESTVCTRWRETLSRELAAITRQSKHEKTNANSADLSVTHSQSVATWTHLQAYTPRDGYKYCDCQEMNDPVVRLQLVVTNFVINYDLV